MYASLPSPGRPSFRKRLCRSQGEEIVGIPLFLLFLLFLLAAIGVIVGITTSSDVVDDPYGERGYEKIRDEDSVLPGEGFDGDYGEGDSEFKGDVTPEEGFDGDYSGAEDYDNEDYSSKSDDGYSSFGGDDDDREHDRDGHEHDRGDHEHDRQHDRDDHDDNKHDHNDGTCHLPSPHLTCLATASMANGEGLIVFEAQAQEYEELDEYDQLKVHCHVECNDEGARRLTDAEMFVFDSERIMDTADSVLKYGVFTSESCCIGYCRSYTPNCETDLIEQECCHKPKPPKKDPRRPQPDRGHDDNRGDCDDCASDHFECTSSCTSNSKCDTAECKNECGGNVNCEAFCTERCDDSECQDNCDHDTEDCAANCSYSSSFGSQ